MRSRAQTIAIILSKYKKKIGSRGAHFEAQASPAIKAMTFYHATDNEAAGLAILESGVIKPPAVTKQSGAMFAPVVGKVYLSPSKENAAIYGLGGVMMEHDPFDRENKSRYGYIFQIDNSKIDDVQPDEDAIGELAHHYLDFKGKIAYASGFSKKRIGESIPYSIRRHADALPVSMKRRMSEGAMWAKVGKRIVNKLSDQEKIDIITHFETHIAHTGPVPIVRAWRIDKRRSKEIKKDGSNLMEIAEEVPIKRPP
jgi:hypothetical protein